MDLAETDRTSTEGVMKFIRQCSPQRNSVHKHPPYLLVEIQITILSELYPTPLGSGQSNNRHNYWNIEYNLEPLACSELVQDKGLMTMTIATQTYRLLLDFD